MNERHIPHPHADYAGYAICGAKIEAGDWHFEDIDHAFCTVVGGYLVQPCHACLNRVVEAFSPHPET